MSKYTDKFKDPRWQKKRLKVLEFFDFTCDNCASTEKSLNVHHLYYEKGRDPWDYPDNAFVALCEDCHEEWHRIKGEIDKLLPSNTYNLERVIGYLKGINNVAPSLCNGPIEMLGMADSYQVGQLVISDLASTGDNIPAYIHKQSVTFEEVLFNESA